MAGRGRPGIYIDLGRVAALLVDRLRTGDTTEFAAIFAAVETLLIEGPADVRDAVTFGLLEGMGNVGGAASVAFRRWFGPVTSAAWAELDRLMGPPG